MEYCFKDIRDICIKSFSLILLSSTIGLYPAYAQQIVPDGYTDTKLNISGNVTDISTTTIQGKNAFNSFSKFNVNKGKEVNLILPDGTENLLNIIKDEATNIDGTLNAVKSGNIGGNVFLVNPYGVIVGTTGIVNAGSLTNITPTKEFVDNFFDCPGNPNPESVIAVLEGTAPNNPDAKVIIKGVIKAIGGESLDQERDYNFSDIVNTDSAEGVRDLVVDSSGATKIIALESTINTQPLYLYNKDAINDKVSGANPLPPIPALTNGRAPIPPIPSLQGMPNDKVSDASPLPPLPLLEGESTDKLNGSIPISPVPMLSNGGAPIPPIPYKSGKIESLNTITTARDMLSSDSPDPGPIDNQRAVVGTTPVKPISGTSYNQRSIAGTTPLKPMNY
ncbi:MAG: leukotoxin LktA family filamentous adhesin [Cyanobacteriota bacterium]